MWRVATTQPSFLIGVSSHDVAAWELPPMALQALSSCKRVLFETDPDAVNQGMMAKASVLAEGLTLDKLLGSAAFATLQQGTGVPAATLRTMEPWLAYLVLLRRWRGPKRSLLSQLVARARLAGKEVAYLEAAGEQINAIDSITTTQWLRALGADLAAPKAARQNLDAQIAAFHRGDAERLAQLVFDESALSRIANFRERIYDNRNGRWLKTLQPHLTTGGTCVVIEVEHLLDQRSLITKLRGRGIGVTRVTH